MPRDSSHLLQWRCQVLAATWLSYDGLYFCRRSFYVVTSSVGEAHD